MVKKFKIRKDDTVQVLTGKDKGKQGKVVQVLTKKDAVIVSGVNMVKKAMKSRYSHPACRQVQPQSPPPDGATRNPELMVSKNLHARTLSL